MDILWRSLLTTCEYDGYTKLYETDAQRPQNAMALLNGCRKWDKLSWNVKVSMDDHHIFNFLTHFMTVFVFILDDLCCHCHMCVLWARLAIKSKRKLLDDQSSEWFSQTHRLLTQNYPLLIIDVAFFATNTPP